MRNWWIVVWTYHLSNLSFGYISNLIRTLHKQPFFGLALITVPMYLHIATKTKLKFDVIHFGPTWWNTKMHQTFYFCPGLNASVTKYLPYRTFYPCLHFGSIGYYRKKMKIKISTCSFAHRRQRANLNSPYVMFLHFQPRYSIPWAALVVSVPFLPALVVQVFLFLILVVLAFLALEPLALLFAVFLALWFLFLALVVLFSLALKFPFSLVSLPSVAFPVFF